MTQGWIFWALLSAAFAALTAIFAKIGISGINSDMATFLRSMMIVVLLAGIVLATGQWQPLGEIGTRSWVFLTLSAAATGGSWLAYFRALKLGEASRVAPIDKFSIVLVAIFGVIFLGEKLSLIHWGGIALIASGALVLAVF